MATEAKRPMMKQDGALDTELLWDPIINKAVLHMKIELQKEEIDCYKSNFQPVAKPKCSKQEIDLSWS